MELSNFDFDEQPLTREDLLQVKGGTAPAYTVTTGTGCSDSGSTTTADCTDGGQKDADA